MHLHRQAQQAPRHLRPQLLTMPRGKYRPQAHLQPQRCRDFSAPLLHLGMGAGWLVKQGPQAHNHYVIKALYFLSVCTNVAVKSAKLGCTSA